MRTALRALLVLLLAVPATLLATAAADATTSPPPINGGPDGHKRVIDQRNKARPRAPYPWQTKVTVGYSRQGRAMTAYQVGDPNAAKVVLVIGQLHGNEKWGYNVAMTMINDWRLVAGARVWVIPTANPDGYAANTRKNAAGVDLNRNFPTDWGAGSPSSGTYGGPSPASEPETKALMAFVKTYAPRQTIVLHQPLYGVDATHTKDVTLRNNLAKYLALPLVSFNCSGVCYGTFTMWINATTAGAGITVEASSAPSDYYTKVTAPDGITRAIGGWYV